MSAFFKYLFGSVLAPAESTRRFVDEVKLRPLAWKIAVFCAFLNSVWSVLEDYLLHQLGSKDTMIEVFNTVSGPFTILVVWFVLELILTVLFYFALIGIVKYLFRFNTLGDEIIAASTMAMLVSVAFLPLSGLSQYFGLIGVLDSLYGLLIVAGLALVFTIIYFREALAVGWGKSTIIVLAATAIILIPAFLIITAITVGTVGTDEFFS